MCFVPFLQALPKDKRFQHTVALLPNISLLNGSKVMESEREDAERAFIRKYMDADTKPSRLETYGYRQKSIGELCLLEVSIFRKSGYYPVISINPFNVV